MTTKVDKVLRQVRFELDDAIEPYFFSDEELLFFVDEAQREFCREVPIKDSTTDSICLLGYKAGATELPYHESITRILSIIREDSTGSLHRIPLATQENRLALNSVGRPDYGNTIDATRELNRPSDYFEIYVDYDDNYLRFSSPPATDAKLQLQVERLPFKDVDSCDMELEIRREYTPAVIAWTCWRAWMKQDRETFDEQAANRQLGLFNDHVIRARSEHQRRHSQPGIVKCAFP